MADKMLYFIFMLKFLLLFVALSCPLYVQANAEMITNCAQLARHIMEGSGNGLRFQLLNVRRFACYDAATNVISEDRWLRVSDDQAAAPSLLVSGKCSPFVQTEPGDRINITGRLVANDSGDIQALVLGMKRLDHDTPILPKDLNGRDFYRSEQDHRCIRLRGTVNEIIKDEIDPRYVYLVLLCQGEIIHAGIGARNITPSNLLGAEIGIIGINTPRLFGNRRFLGRTLQASTINIIKTPPVDPFDLPDISRISFQTPNEISRAGRHRAQGRVSAVWNHGRSFLLRTDADNVVQVDHMRTNAPAIGATVKAAGIPLTNTHCLNLTRADWTNDTNTISTARAPTVRQTNAHSIMEDDANRVMIKPQYHGKLIQLSGVVRCLFLDEMKNNRLLIEDDGYLIPIDPYACPNATEQAIVGSKVSVTGVCIMDIENPNPGIAFPRIRGFSVIPRCDTDIVILSRPPWLTRERLMAVIGGLALLLIGVLAWNASLRILANRRGRELFRSQVGKIASELRVKERTRLAVELHDSLAQNLTGVSMEIEAAERSRKDGLEAVSQHLVIADKALKSCRAELRNSLWDLRSQALEEPDLDKAIRQTLLPHVKGISLFVRFNVPRSRFSDNTLHEILRIIRELSLNGIRHGGATEIRIAGAIDGDLLRFSVQDNGCGFDPDDHPGVTDGHFGLQGISERLDTYSGELSFSSAPGKGTKAVVTIPLPGQKDPEK